MTLVVNCRFLTQPLTGVQRFAEEITKRVAAARDDVILVAPRQELRFDSLGGKKVLKIGHLKGHLWEQTELGRFSRKHRAVLLSLANTGPMWLSDQLIVIHDITWARFPESYSWAFRAFYRRMTRALIRRSRELATVSDFSRHDISSFFGVDPQRFKVVPNAVDQRFFDEEGTRPKTLPEDRYFLTVSSLARHKNVAGLVTEYRTAHLQNPDLPSLVLVGSGARSFANVDLEEGEDGVVSLGRVSDSELIWLYRNADAFVFPSLYEGFGIPPLEAQACGCPVISSTAASLPEVLRGSALFYEPGVQGSLSNRLHQISHDRYRIMALREAGERNVMRYQWGASAQIIQQALESVRT